MPTRNVVITDHQAALLDRLVAEGRYQNASEVLREGLRLVEEREERFRAKLEAFKAAIAEGERAIAEGRYVDLETDEDVQRFFEGLGKA
ncbi:type II toxin-antitoxin system ParD family antitoxin [Siccirubricoccus phaeus]|uniref:type II toxin-antitoxin system ParD family antitoxin n=1 Tax=Siccirubricoccus phaeus TaxID=2595053 RepID=UPI0011F1B1B3|nr:type II toxin-antitoxin system ParD family antitoxin [Siccirubricoccus phaeus]